MKMLQQSFRSLAAGKFKNEHFVCVAGEIA